MAYSFAVMSERAKRMEQMRKGFAEMGKLWYTCTSITHSRIVFVAKVQSATWSGLTAFVGSQKELSVIDNGLCKLLRKISQGRASEKCRRRLGDVQFVQPTTHDKMVYCATFCRSRCAAHQDVSVVGSLPVRVYAPVEKLMSMQGLVLLCAQAVAEHACRRGATEAQEVSVGRAVRHERQ